jgi:hypothetical protein
MKRKLIVTLVATALELYAAAAGAQAAATCTLVGNATSANGATASRVGPLNPIDGFPEFITDSTGQAIQRCIDPLHCFFDPVIPTDPFSIQIGSGGEAFYWGATAVLDDGSRRVATVVMAAESAFLQFGPKGEPIDGSQFPFLRLRFTIGVPKDGTYTVTHPYGVDKFTVVGATGARDIFATVDRGLNPGSAVQGPVGPWLKWDPANLTNGAVIPPGFLGDGLAGGPSAVTGSPCGNNFVRLTGTDTTGRAVIFGNGLTKVETALFGVQGKIFDGRVQTPLNASRMTYSRTIAGAGQIETFAETTATASVSVVDGPTIALGSGRIALPVTLDRTGLSLTAGIDSLAVPVTDASALPPIVAMTATDPVATDPTTLNLHLVDYVDITAADFDPATGRLSVTASSADLRAAPALTLRDFGTFTAGQPTVVVNTIAPPGVVHVDSAKGGSASALVRVIASAAPSAPAGLSSPSATSTTVTLNWADTSANETGFTVYTVAAGGARSAVATVAANATSAVISGLAPATAYTFQVDAFNSAGAASSGTLTVNTLALPVIPSGVAATVSTTQQRAINISWTDNSSDETSFQILRATAVGGPYAQVATLAGAAGTGVRSIVDASGPPSTNTTYFYQVLAVRGPDSSAAATSAGVSTPTAAASALAVTPTVVSPTQVNITWTDRAINETGYQVYRRSGAAGAFTSVSGVLGAGTTSFSDTTVVAGTQYFYRVDVSNWAGAVQSAVSVGVTPQGAGGTVTLLAPTNLAASAAAQSVLTWTDASTGETGYRVRRTAFTVNTNGSLTAGAPVVLSQTLAANAAAFVDLAATSGATVQYDVAALNGATVGALATAYAVPGGLPVANRPNLARTNGVAQVTVTWTALTTASVGGYEVQRCTGNGCTSFVKVPGTAVATAGTVDGRATATFVDNTVARNTTYTYLMRVVGGGTTGLAGAVSATRTVSTN